jgi:hypothetical protein
MKNKQVLVESKEEGEIEGIQFLLFDLIQCWGERVNGQKNLQQV